MNRQREELQKAIQKARQHGPLQGRIYLRGENANHQHSLENIGRVCTPSNVRAKRGR